MTIEDTIGRVLRNERERRNWSQRQFAARLGENGLPRTYVSKLENGKASPTIKSLVTICGALGMSISEFFELCEEYAPGKDDVRRPHGWNPSAKSTEVPRGALVTNLAAVAHRREIARALGTLPKESR